MVMNLLSRIKKINFYPKNDVVILTTSFCIIMMSLCEVKIMIKGEGIDSVEVERVKKIVDKSDSFAKKVLTPNEFAQY